MWPWETDGGGWSRLQDLEHKLKTQKGCIADTAFTAGASKNQHSQGMGGNVRSLTFVLLLSFSLKKNFRESRKPMRAWSSLPPSESRWTRRWETNSKARFEGSMISTETSEACQVHSCFLYPKRPVLLTAWLQVQVMLHNLVNPNPLGKGHQRAEVFFSRCRLQHWAWEVTTSMHESLTGREYVCNSFLL